MGMGVFLYYASTLVTLTGSGIVSPSNHNINLELWANVE